MCLICDHLDSKKINPWEAARNRREMLGNLEEKHLIELNEKIERALLDYLDEKCRENQ